MTKTFFFLKEKDFFLFYQVWAKKKIIIIKGNEKPSSRITYTHAIIKIDNIYSDWKYITS